MADAAPDTALPARRLTLLVVYFQRDLWPMRPAFEAHIFCWKRYAPARVLHLNLGFPYDAARLRDLKPDVVIYDSSALTLRWYPIGLEPLLPAARALAETAALKVALPHDEFLLTDAMVGALKAADVRLILSVLEPSTWPELYGPLIARGVRIERILTGYLDDRDLAYARRRAKPLQRRRWRLRYRAWDAEAWAGPQGKLKVEVGERAAELCARRGWSSDVSFDQGDTVGGRGWFDFLADAWATVGCEGGSSFLDRDGALKAASDARQPLPPAIERVPPYAALSPRHLEAAATRTLQLLVEAPYDGVLQAGVHYVPVRRDLSDLDAALDMLSHVAAVEAMTERAFQDVAASGCWTWSRFAKSWCARWAIEMPGGPGPSRNAAARRRIAEARGRLTMRLEHLYGSAPAPVHRGLRLMLRWAKPLLQRPQQPFA